MKKFVTLFSFITVLGLILSACGGAAATQVPAQTEAPVATSAPATEAPTATEVPAEETTLTLWVYDDGRLEVLKKLGEQFKT